MFNIHCIFVASLFKPFGRTGVAVEEVAPHLHDSLMINLVQMKNMILKVAFEIAFSLLEDTVSEYIRD